MPLMSALSDPVPGWPCWHFDGQTALRHTPRLIAEGAHFTLEDDALAPRSYRFADLVALDRQGGDTVFGLKGDPGWRLGFAGDPPGELSGVLPRVARYGAVIDRFGLWPSALVLGLIAAAVVFGVAQAPSLLARLVPRSVERQLGEAMVGDFGGQLCRKADSDVVLTKLATRLGAAPDEVEIGVVNLPVVNAITLPGGRILIFDGLLRGALSPDELAGVIGHELGHVSHRDVLESLLRQLGLSVLLGGLDGHIAGYTNALLATAYSRDAEARADDYAIAALGEAHISPAATAGFFRRLSGEKGKPSRSAIVLNYLATHPIPANRADKFLAAGRGRADFTPALSAEDWAILRDACVGQPRKPLMRFGF